MGVRQLREFNLALLDCVRVERVGLRDGGSWRVFGMEETNPWVDGTSLRERFGRLFDLAENKSTFVVEMFMQGWETGGEAWVWRRQIGAWEEEMSGECQSLLLTLSLQDHVSDRWQWQSDLDDVYTVRGAYQLLTTHDVVTLDVATFGALWSLVSSWIGSSLVNAQSPSDHFVQFTDSAGSLRARRSFMQLIWLAVVWVVWTER
ncbi:hypothetical protein L195_g046513, partial [Trifolium pratense]